MQSTSTDFTKIENLIAKPNDQVLQNQNRQRQNIPYFYVFPVLCRSREDYYQKFGHIQLNTPCITVSKPGSQLDSGSVENQTKRKSTFTFEQIKLLSERFGKSNRIDKEDSEDLAKKVGLTPVQVKTWFLSRRIGEARRENIKRRIPYSVDQIAMLEEKFAESNYINKLENIELAKKTKLRENQIRGWFVKRREEEQKKMQKFSKLQ